MQSCIIFQNSSATITILDIPTSIELAQGASHRRRLVSSIPRECPYISVEPKSAKGKAAIEHTSLEVLLLRKHLELALDEIKTEFKGPWCLARYIADIEHGEKIPPEIQDEIPREREHSGNTKMLGDQLGVKVCHILPGDDLCFFNNPNPEGMNLVLPSGADAFIPPHSKFFQGDISATLIAFVEKAPKFNIILLDPPWPNRSARRKASYSIPHGDTDIRTLLSSIPLYDHLTDNGYVAVWITNKPLYREMVVGEGGLFDEWGVQLCEEWIWLKVTVNGEPIFSLDSTWRKPYEVLLLGKRGGGDIKKRVIVAVPDLHSRKPNLQSLFEKLVSADKYLSLEIFARNLTAGCWSWGDEALKFQTAEHWAS